MSFPQQGGAGVVFQAQRQIEIVEAPDGKINGFKVVIFSVGGKDAAGSGIDQAAKAEGDSGTGFRRDEIATEKRVEEVRDKGEGGCELQIVSDRGVRGIDERTIAYQSAGGVATTEVDREEIHG